MNKNKNNYINKENKISGFDRKERRLSNLKQRGYISWDEEDAEEEPAAFWEEVEDDDDEY